MFAVYHPSMGVRFFPEGQEVPPGWYRTPMEAERARFVRPVAAPVERPTEPVPAILLPFPPLEEMRKRAEELGIRIDRRWGIETLRREIAKVKQ